MSATASLNTALAGRYVIEREVGAGGMAVVYLAHDVRHRRNVALKVLRPELAAVIGADRFLREIETTARLQHPHILPLHDSGTVEGTAFYVMPYVEGESLRDRLRRETQLPLDDAIRIAREVASALDYAHRQRVVHRDIKPENILLHDGEALVADFGIALAVSSAGGGTRMTETGMSLGTPHYMSPEQAMGDREITPRSDVYALGCVVYEMLVGEPPFTGPSAQAVIARVVTENPRSLSQQRRTIPAHVDAAVQRALEKLPADRFATAAEFSAALATAGATTTGYTPATSERRSVPARAWLSDARTLGLAVLAIAAVGVTSMLHGGDGPAAGVARTTLGAPDTGSGYFANAGRTGVPATSPDGRIVAYSLARGAGAALLVKFPDRFDLWAIPGGGRTPTFSPDGRWIAYIRDDGVWKIRVDGGEPVRLSALPEPATWNVFGAAWHPSGDVFVAGSMGMWAVPAAGGEPRLVRRVDSLQTTPMSWPSLAPDGRLIVQISVGRSARVAFLSADGLRIDTLPADFGVPAWFVDRDIFVFRRAGQPMATRFDARSLRTRGPTIPLSRDLRAASPGITAAWFDATNQARLEPVWVDRTGNASLLGLDATYWRHPRPSPEGSRIAITNAGVNEVYVYNVASRSRVAIAKGAGEATWTNDGRRVIVSTSDGVARYGLIARAADGSGVTDTLFAGAQEAWPTDVARGDSVLVFYGVAPNDRADLFFYNMRSKTTRHVSIPGEQRGARFSPDGRWLAYQSTEGGRMEIIVQPWPALDAKYNVSTEGGEEPVWSRDGRELYYRSGDAIMMARVRTAGAFEVAPAVPLFRVPYERDLWGDQSYDVASNGRFLMFRRALDSRVQVRVVYNWAEELRRQLDEANRK